MYVHMYVYQKQEQSKLVNSHLFGLVFTDIAYYVKKVVKFQFPKYRNFVALTSIPSNIQRNSSQICAHPA